MGYFMTTMDRARVSIRRPRRGDETEFLALMRQSSQLHHPWVFPPTSRAAFLEYLATRRLDSEDGFLVIERQSQRICGVINLNVITRGALQSAYVAYYVGQPYVGQGYMKEGLLQAMAVAFGELGLHRLEANIQPGNTPSIRLVRACGFRHEGFSPKYLYIDGAWRDHERFAILKEEVFF